MENSVFAIGLLIFVAGLPVVSSITGSIVDYIFPADKVVAEVRQKPKAT